MILDRVDSVVHRLGFTPISIKMNEWLGDKKLIPVALFPVVMDTNGILYYTSSHCLVNDVDHTARRCNFDDLRKTDVVLDIGSHIGEFALTVCDRVKEVHAIEPLFYNTVTDHVSLNKKENIFVHPYGVGEEGEVELEYFSEPKMVKFYPLSHWISTYGCDFLNSNCEGGEWGFSVDDLKPIRRIEIEFHTFCKNKRPELIEEIKEYFEVETNEIERVIELHGWNHNV